MNSRCYGKFLTAQVEINPERQGEVFLPAPKKNWLPSSRKWEDNKWQLVHYYLTSIYKKHFDIL